MEEGFGEGGVDGASGYGNERGESFFHFCHLGAEAQGYFMACDWHDCG